MSMPFKFVILSAFLVSLIACNQEKKHQAKSSDAQKVVQDEKNEKIDLGKYGVSQSSADKIKKLKVGEIAPDFNALDMNGNEFSLSELANDKDVLLLFYRGYWCPYCTKNLAQYADSLSMLEMKNIKVVAIAPEGSDNMGKTMEETSKEITFISDQEAKILDLYNVGFEVNDAYNERFSNWKGESLASVNGQEKATLPIPACYLVGKDLKIKYSFFDPDYSKRSSVKDILDNI